MMFPFLVGCNADPGLKDAPEPVPFSLDITLPDGSADAAGVPCISSRII